MLVVRRLPLQFLAVLPRVLQLRLVEVATAAGSGQVLLQLSYGHSHFLHLGMILLFKRKIDGKARNERNKDKDAKRGRRGKDGRRVRTRGQETSTHKRTKGAVALRKYISDRIPLSRAEGNWDGTQSFQILVAFF